MSKEKKIQIIVQGTITETEDDYIIKIDIPSGEVRISCED